MEYEDIRNFFYLKFQLENEDFCHALIRKYLESYFQHLSIFLVNQNVHKKFSIFILNQFHIDLS